MSGQSGGHRIQLSKLNDQLTCKLCGGYFIDATTIIECLHSFCRSCIVRYLENNKYCPICEVQVHKSKPLLNIRPDHTLQDIVYKLVPGCYQNEMRCRREFYSKHPEACAEATSPEARGEPTESHIYSPDESLSLSLEYFSPSMDAKEVAVKPLLRRYLRCPAAVTIFHLQKLIRAKYGLTDGHRVDILYKEEPLCSSYTLMDVMYIYHWRRKVPLHLSYRIFESSPKRIKLSEDNVNFKTSLLNAGIDPVESKEDKSTRREWKEVQLKISETGIMSITDITDQQFKKRIEEPITSVETISTSAIEDKASKRNMSEAGKENERSSDRQSIRDCNASSKLNEQRNSNETEVKTSTEEIESLMNSKHEGESKTRPNNNNIEDKAILQKIGQSEGIVDCGNENEIHNNNIEKKDQKEPTKNNNNIIAESKLDKHNAKNEVKSAGTGSKINALSVKLQFQPKTGQQMNSSNSWKKTVKDRKVLPQSSKKSDVKIGDGSRTTEIKNSVETPRALTNNCGVTMNKSPKQKPDSESVTEPVLSTHPSTSASSESRKTETTVRATHRDGRSADTERSAEKKSSSDESWTESLQRTNGQVNTLPQKSPYPQIEPLTNNNLASLNLSTSLSVSVGNGINSASTSTFPYSVQHLVNSTLLKNSLKGLTTSSSPKLPENPIPTSSVTETPLAFTVPPINASSSVKNSYPSLSTSSSKESTSKPSSLEMTSTYSVPPCPDAIPISLMKSTIRKNELIMKGSNLNEICAKIGASGSKINDICAKIGESSKEKNKTEARSKSDIPDLLKIGRKNGTSPITTDPVSKQPQSQPQPQPQQQQKQHASIPNIPVYSANSSATITAESKNSYSSMKDGRRGTSVTTSHSLQKVPAFSKRHGQPIGYKTLRDPPKCWNPILSKSNYITVKNQNRAAQNQLHQTALFDGKTIQSKPAKIFKMRNMPRYLGNPASGVKPMYGIGTESKEKEQLTMTSTATTNTSTSSKNGNTSMMKIDPKTLSPIVSTVNSPIVSPPPYSPSARNYSNSPFSRDICRSTGSPISPKNSPVNMLSTSPFIPSPTPNINPRLIYTHFPPPFPDARFPNPLIRPPIGISSPSAFHSSLPPSINNIYQRSSYIPQTTGFSSVSQPPTVQRIPPSTYSSPKSSKTTSLTAISPASYSMVKSETQTVATSSLETNKLHLPEKPSQEDVSAFNLSKTGTFSNADIPKSETSRNSKSIPLSPTSSGQSKNSVIASPKKSEASPGVTDRDQGKERAEKEVKCEEQNSSEGQNAEKSLDGKNDDVIQSENSDARVNGDLTNESKEETTPTSTSPSPTTSTTTMTTATSTSATISTSTSTSTTATTATTTATATTKEKVAEEQSEQNEAKLTREETPKEEDEEPKSVTEQTKEQENNSETKSDQVET